MCRKMKLDYLHIPHTKINTKCIKDLNVRSETIKIVEENMGSKISDIAPSNIFQIYHSRQGNQKKKIYKWDYTKLKSFGTVKKIINKIKRQPMEWENINDDTSDKVLIFSIYKELIILNTHTHIHTHTMNYKMGKGPE